MIRVGVIGYGYWGPNLVRNMFEATETQVVAVSDMREERLSLVHGRYPSVNITTDHRELLDDPEIDAIAIATPVHAHYDLALQALQSGKHVFVEKPMTSTSQQALRLIDEAERRNLVLDGRSHVRLHRRSAQNQGPGSVRASSATFTITIRPASTSASSSAMSM